MLKHCIFATFGRDFELAAVTAFSKKLAHFLYVPRFPLILTNSMKTVEQAIGPGNPRAAAWGGLPPVLVEDSRPAPLLRYKSWGKSPLSENR